MSAKTGAGLRPSAIFVKLLSNASKRSKSSGEGFGAEHTVSVCVCVCVCVCEW